MNEVARDPETGMSQQEIVDKIAAEGAAYAKEREVLRAKWREAVIVPLQHCCGRIGHVLKPSNEIGLPRQAVRTCVICGLVEWRDAE